MTIFLLILLALIAVLLIYAATKPDVFCVERELLMNAAPERIFPHINNFHLWQAWTPYNKDPNMKREFAGPESGVGAKLAWEGDKKVGKGEITIIESLSPFKIGFDLHMMQPFAGRNHVEIHLKKIDEKTLVVWQLKDKHTYFLKLLSTLMDMDKMIGTDFEVGLAQLKSIVEKN